MFQKYILLVFWYREQVTYLHLVESLWWVELYRNFPICFMTWTETILLFFCRSGYEVVWCWPVFASSIWGKSRSGLPVFLPRFEAETSPSAFLKEVFGCKPNFRKWGQMFNTPRDRWVQPPHGMRTRSCLSCTVKLNALPLLWCKGVHHILVMQEWVPTLVKAVKNMQTVSWSNICKFNGGTPLMYIRDVHSVGGWWTDGNSVCLFH